MGEILLDGWLQVQLFEVPHAHSKPYGEVHAHCGLLLLDEGDTLI
jgi:hypothetical protein